MAQAKTYEHENLRTYLSDKTAQTLIRPHTTKPVKDPILEQEYWMHTPQKGTRSFHKKPPLKNNVFGKKDLRRLERLENTVDHVEDTIEGLLQSMHVQYSIFDATSTAIQRELLRLKGNKE